MEIRRLLYIISFIFLISLGGIIQQYIINRLRILDYRSDLRIRHILGYSFITLLVYLILFKITGCYIKILELSIDNFYIYYLLSIIGLLSSTSIEEEVNIDDRDGEEEFI